MADNVRYLDLGFEPLIERKRSGLELSSDAGSASGRPGLDDADRRQLLYFDAQRQGTADAAQLRHRVGASVWQVAWGTANDLDPRLYLKLHVGPVEAMAWGELSGRQCVAVATREIGEYGVGWAYRLRLWDVRSEQSRGLASDEPCSCLSFAAVAGEPMLVSGHGGGLVRVWSADGTLRRAVKTGPSDVVDLYVADTEWLTQVVTLDAAGRVRCWSLSSGELVRELDAPRPFCIAGARLADGRYALVTCGDGLSLWDLGRGERLPVRAPQEWKHPQAIQLSTSHGSDRITVVALSVKVELDTP